MSIAPVLAFYGGWVWGRIRGLRRLFIRIERGCISEAEFDQLIGISVVLDEV